jgi:leukotriene-A4 hydrolase
VRFNQVRNMATNPRDPNTVSNYNNWRSIHITANFDILFDQKKLVGNVVHQFKSITNAESREIILDTSHLDIGTVKVNGQPSKWELLPPLEPFGVPLKISLEQGVDLGGTVEVDVCFKRPTKLLHSLSNPMIDCRGNNRQVHGTAMVDSGANLEQEAPVHV